MTRPRGFALAELLIACAVLGVLLAGMFTLLQGGQFAYLWGAARVQAQQNTRWTLDMMSRELRTALSITSTPACNTGATSITFVDQNGTTIQYTQNGDTLAARQWQHRRHE
jgi:prepilin-type N-terminal cleavage/methylation domain-containing protein